MNSHPRNTSVQNEILSSLCTQQASVIVYMINGFRLSGRLTNFDTFTIILEENNTQYIIYKHAISTIIPSKLIDSLSELG